MPKKIRRIGGILALLAGCPLLVATAQTKTDDIPSLMYGVQDPNIGIAFTDRIEQSVSKDGVLIPCETIIRQYDPRKKRGDRVTILSFENKAPCNKQTAADAKKRLEDGFRPDLSAAGAFVDKYEAGPTFEVISRQDNVEVFRTGYRISPQYSRYSEKLRRQKSQGKGSQYVDETTVNAALEITVKDGRLLKMVQRAENVTVGFSKVSQLGVYEYAYIDGCCPYPVRQTLTSRLSGLGQSQELYTALTILDYELVSVPFQESPNWLLYDNRFDPASVQSDESEVFVSRRAARTLDRFAKGTLEGREKGLARLQRLKVSLNQKAVPKKELQQFIKFLVAYTLEDSVKLLSGDGSGFEVSMAKDLPELLRDRMVSASEIAKQYAASFPASRKGTENGGAHFAEFIVMSIAAILDQDAVALDLAVTLESVNAPLMLEGAQAAGAQQLRDQVGVFVDAVIARNLENDAQSGDQLFDLINQRRAWLATSEQQKREIRERLAIQSPSPEPAKVADDFRSRHVSQALGLITADEAIDRAGANAIIVVSASPAGASMAVKPRQGLGKSDAWVVARVEQSDDRASKEIKRLLAGTTEFQNLAPSEQFDVGYELSEVFETGDGWLNAIGNAATKPQVVAEIDAMEPKLWSLFGAPISDALRRASVPEGSKVLVMVNGTASILPIQASRNPVTGERLIDTYQMSFVPNLTEASVKRSEAPRAWQVGGVFNPTGDLDFASLERDLIASAASSPVGIVEAGTSPQSALLELKSSNIWHFATHGDIRLFDIESSGLILGPTIENALRLADLRGASIRPELIVLSACDLGMIDVSRNPDALVGLPAGFLEAGAGNVVSSLWIVDDLSTSFLMARFYDELFSGEQDTVPSAALRHAQLWLKSATADDLMMYLIERQAEHPDTILPNLPQAMAYLERFESDQRVFEHPYYWAGFSLFGAN